jgi:hypothetical protein
LNGPQDGPPAGVDAVRQVTRLDRSGTLELASELTAVPASVARLAQEDIHDKRPAAYHQERERWRNFPGVRPDGIVIPGPGQESVWDYPRPTRVEPITARVRVAFEGLTIADTGRALRECEAAGGVDRVTRQPGFYYGWVTPSAVGPFKGVRGSESW